MDKNILFTHFMPLCNWHIKTQQNEQFQKAFKFWFQQLQFYCSFFRCARFTFINYDNFIKVRHDISRNFKNKRVVFVKYKINEPETNTKNKNNSDLYKEKIMWRQTYVSKYGNFRIILYIQDCGNSENLQVQPLHTPF